MLQDQYMRIFATNNTEERKGKATLYSSDCSSGRTVCVQVLLKIFSVNIELAQKFVLLHEELDEGFENEGFGIKSGIVNAVHYLCTEVSEH